MVTLGAAWISSDLVASSDIKFESSHTAKIKENLPLLVVVLEEFQGVFTQVFGVFFACLFVSVLHRPS